MSDNFASSVESRYEIPRPLPPPEPVKITLGLTLVTPQSRKGFGPGIIVLVDEAASGLWIDGGVPSVFMKWAEEGYCVAEISKKAWDDDSNPLERAVQELYKTKVFDASQGVGLVCYEPSLLEHLSTYLQSAAAAVKAVVCYSPSITIDSTVSTKSPILWHLTSNSTEIVSKASNSYLYASHDSAFFATPRKLEFDYSTEALSHSRSLSFLKKHMGGPYFDLEAIWDEHTYYEFEDRSLENTMNTMVAEPYVNHIPTLTGGVGRTELSDFYQNHFIFSNPEDAELELISRTTGIDRIVDEFIYKCTHDRVIDWLLPGVPPTNVAIEIPMMAVVNIRGDRLYHEHISWDHATALKQVGLLPEHVSLDRNTTGEQSSTLRPNGVTKTLRLPVVGKEGAAKLRDRVAFPSNEMFSWNQ